MPRSPSRIALTSAVLLLVACDPKSCNRQDIPDASIVVSDGGNGVEAGESAQCSGWFPDWISPNPPPAGTESFQLAQGYPLGVPVLEVVNDQIKITRWDPPAPSTTTADAPWLAHDFHDPTQRAAYLDDLKAYLLEGNDTADFVAQKNVKRSWYHVAMMTSNEFSRREPYHGLTKERALRSCDHKWILDASPCTDPSKNLNAYAIGAYNWLGGYTIGQVFKDPNAQLSDPAAGKFIAGAFVFKLLFAEYDTAKIDATLDPLTGAPEWSIQDVGTPATANRKVRLLQVDVAVRDDRSTQTGWVFATFVYDKAMTTETNAWRRLRPVGVMWGADPDVTGPGVGTVDETWLAPGIPAALQRQDGNPYGRDGRLNGPVDNRFSACISCHSTAQIVIGASTRDAFRGADLFPPPPGPSCSGPAVWFRNVLAGAPFGVMTNGGNGCDLLAPQPATPPLRSLDYSLQVADALESSLFDQDKNPCAAMGETLRGVDSRDIPPGDRGGKSVEEVKRALSKESLRDPRRLEIPIKVQRALAPAPKLVKVTPTPKRRVDPERDKHRR